MRLDGSSYSTRSCRRGSFAWLTASSTGLVVLLSPVFSDGKNGGRQSEEMACNATAYQVCPNADDFPDCKECTCTRSFRIKKAHCACDICKQGYEMFHGSCVNVDKKTIVMIRHGQSQWNQYMEHSKTRIFHGKWQIWKDSPLSEFGLLQAARLAAVLANAANPNLDATNEVLQEIVSKQELLTVKHGKLFEQFQDSVYQLKHPDDHKTILDILTGQHCESTAVVSSQLVRAMDTLQIALLQFRVNCPLVEWEISSNLQEIDGNNDCESRTEVHEKPTLEEPVDCQANAGTDMGPKCQQTFAYAKSSLSNTFKYIKQAYASSNINRFLKNHPKGSRATMKSAGPNHQGMRQLFDAELEDLFGTRNSKIENAIWGGHSIWFRKFFRFYGADDACRLLAKHDGIPGADKMANTAVVSMKVFKLRSPIKNTKFAVKECEFAYLGMASKYKLLPVVPPVPPVPVEVLKPYAALFYGETSEIDGYKRCCNGVIGNLQCEVRKTKKCNTLGDKTLRSRHALQKGNLSGFKSYVLAFCVYVFKSAFWF